MKSDAGFSESVDTDLLKEAKIDSVDDFQKHVCLTFDEVRIKEDLVYDKHSCRIIGFVNLGSFSDELLELVLFAADIRTRLHYACASFYYMIAEKH